MSYLALALAFATVGFVVANAAISLLLAVAWRFLRPLFRGARLLFVVRMLPTIGSVAIVLGCVVPAFLLFEPRRTSERPGVALVVFALLAFVLLGAGLRRATVSWLYTRRLERLWRTAAVDGAGFQIPVRSYRVRSDMPFAALVGVVRPRLFVADRFIEGLAAGERQAVLDHEVGHLRALDNLKRIVMKLAPDWLSFSTISREIEAAWAVAAEETADDHAAGPDRARSLDLAGALLTAARSAPMSCAPVSNFCDDATIARRVCRLLDDSPTRSEPARAMAPRFAWILAVMGAATLLAWPVLQASYSMTEAAIRLMQ